MSSAAFESLESPVRWTRKILLVKRRFLILVDQLHSDTAHEYSWLFHFASTTVHAVNSSRSRLLTGFEDHNLFVAPFQPQLFSPVEITEGHVNKKSRNVPASVSRFVTRATDRIAAFLFLPVNSREFPSVELQQSTDTDNLSLRIRVEGKDVRVLIKPSSEVVITETAAMESVREVSNA